MASNVRTDYTIGLKDDTRAGFQSIEQNLSRLKSSFSGAFAVLAGGGLAAGFGAMVKGAINTADEMGKLASKAGTTVEAFTALNYAASLADVSTEQLGTGLRILSKNAEAAAEGSSKARAIFERLGITVQDASGALKPTGALFEEVARKLGNLPDGATKTALAMQALGKSGAELIPLLNDGADGFERITAEAKKAGQVIDGETSKAAQQFNDDMTRLNKSFEGIAISLAKDLVPGLATLSTEFVRAVNEGSGFLRVLEAIPRAIQRASEGNSTKQLGALINSSVSLDTQESRIRKNPGRADGTFTQADQQALDAIAARRAELERQIAGLKATMQPQEFGAAAADAAPKAIAQPIVKAAETATLAVKATSKAIKDSLDTESVQVARYLDEYAKQRTQIEKEAADHLEALRESIRTPREKAVRELADFNQAFGSLSDEYGRKAIDAFNELNPELDTAASSTDKISQSAQELGLTFSSAFEDAIVSGKSFSDILTSIGQDILRITTQQLVTKPLKAGIEGFFNSGGGSAIGSGISSFFSGLFGGARAGGGPVSGGRAYLVGERGPEIMIPGSSGTIIPNGAGGGGVTINNYGAAPAKVRDRMVNGRRQIDQFFADAAGSTTASGRLAPLGIRPALASR